MSDYRFMLDKTKANFYGDNTCKQEEHIWVKNPGMSEMSFRFKSTNTDTVIPSPLRGKLKPGEILKVTVKCNPYDPTKVKRCYIDDRGKVYDDRLSLYGLELGKPIGQARMTRAEIRVNYYPNGDQGLKPVQPGAQASETKQEEVKEKPQIAEADFDAGGVKDEFDDENVKTQMTKLVSLVNPLDAVAKEEIKQAAPPPPPPEVKQEALPPPQPVIQPAPQLAAPESVRQDTKFERTQFSAFPGPPPSAASNTGSSLGMDSSQRNQLESQATQMAGLTTRTAPNEAPKDPPTVKEVKLGVTPNTNPDSGITKSVFRELSKRTSKTNSVAQYPPLPDPSRRAHMDQQRSQIAPLNSTTPQFPPKDSSQRKPSYTSNRQSFVQFKSEPQQFVMGQPPPNIPEANTQSEYCKLPPKSPDIQRNNQFQDTDRNAMSKLCDLPKDGQRRRSDNFKQLSVSDDRTSSSSTESRYCEIPKTGTGRQFTDSQSSVGSGTKSTQDQDQSMYVPLQGSGSQPRGSKTHDQSMYVPLPGTAPQTKGSKTNVRNDSDDQSMYCQLPGKRPPGSPNAMQNQNAKFTSGSDADPQSMYVSLPAKPPQAAQWAAAKAAAENQSTYAKLPQNQAPGQKSTLQSIAAGFHKAFGSKNADQSKYVVLQKNQPPVKDNQESQYVKIVKKQSY